MSPFLVRLCGVAAIVGGTAWLLKASAIIITGVQPDYLFEFAPAFLAIGLIGLHGRLGARGGRMARIGGILAHLVLIAALINAVTYARGALVTTEETFSPLTFISFLGTIVSLILIGLAYRRTAESLIRWQSLPLVIGVVTVPFGMFGGSLLEMINERLFELPVLLLGIGWIFVGLALVDTPTGPGIAPE